MILFIAARCFTVDIVERVWTAILVSLIYAEFVPGSCHYIVDNTDSSCSTVVVLFGNVM